MAVSGKGCLPKAAKPQLGQCAFLLSESRHVAAVSLQSRLRSVLDSHTLHLELRVSLLWGRCKAWRPGVAAVTGPSLQGQALEWLQQAQVGQGEPWAPPPLAPLQAAMSESGHSQPGLYGIERRRRWKEPSPGGPQNLSGPGGREREYVAPWERERRVSD